MASNTLTKSSPKKPGTQPSRAAAPAKKVRVPGSSGNPAAGKAGKARAPSVAAKSAPAKQTAAKSLTPAKAKLVRDSFTLPASDFALIASMKERALSFKRPTKKSELLRAGLQMLAASSDASLRTALEALAPLKPGRPKKTA